MAPVLRSFSVSTGRGTLSAERKLHEDRAIVNATTAAKIKMNGVVGWLSFKKTSIDQFKRTGGPDLQITAWIVDEDVNFQGL